MKRLLSVALIFSLLLSMTAMSAFSTSAATVDVTQISENALNSLENVLADLEISKVEKTDVATTSVRTFSISEKAGVNYDDVDGYIYGYVGDADGDDNISVMDATAIQLHLAQTQLMNATVCKIADADMDNSTTVMDATAIQLHLASIKESASINHVLYTPYDNFDPTIDTFDDIANYLKENGEHYEDTNVYYVSEFETADGANVYATLEYHPKHKMLLIFIQTHMIEEGFYLNSSFSVIRGNPTFSISTYMSTDELEDDLYFLGSKGNMVGMDENFVPIMEFEHEEFTSDYGLNITDVEESLTDLANLSIVSLQYFIDPYVVGTAFDLVYDVQSLIRE